MSTSDILTKDDIAKLDQRLSGVEEDVSELKKDVCELKKDVSELKKDVSELKKDVGELKKDVTSLKEDVRRVEILQEHMDGKLDAIIEILTPNLESTVVIREQVDNHETRIAALERFKKQTA